MHICTQWYSLSWYGSLSPALVSTFSHSQQSGTISCWTQKLSRNYYSITIRILKVGSRQNFKNRMDVYREFHLQKKHILVTMFECTMHQLHKNLNWKFGVPEGSEWNRQWLQVEQKKAVVIYSSYIFYTPFLYYYLLLLHFGQKQKIQWFIVALVNLSVEACCWRH